jgi:TolB-like protein
MNTRNSVNQANKVNPLGILLLAFCSLLLAFSLLPFTVGAGYAAQPSQKLNIALFPFENFSEDKNALTVIMPLLRDRLEARGLDVLNEDSLNRFLLKERIRSTGYISRDIARKIREELNVQAILVGSVNSFFPGENPRVGFSARLINSSDGSILWANHASATGEDFATVLGLGKVKTIDRLISKVIDKLLDSFSITPHYKEIESTYRIAVMPFQNKSKIKDAGMIATYMFLVELFKNQGFQPVEYGEVRRLTVDLRVRGKGELDLKNTETISKSLGADGILVGTVELYNEGEGTLPPEVIISARLIDVRKNRILWYDGYQYSGEDGIIILDWGRIRSVENVAYKAVSKLVKEMGKAKWH